MLARVAQPPPVAARPVCRHRRWPCVRDGQAAPPGRPQPSDRPWLIWAIGGVPAWPVAAVDSVHGGPDPSFRKFAVARKRVRKIVLKKQGKSHIPLEHVDPNL
ncbi:hypothetical protein [Oryza sativa Japonica Group]|uniref:Uncharacterized protein n=1 Tax=Oryza sativa subsp. japonica TaxID=39947 RepID=Q5JKS9_ORYSJ|nr:hypothetical protein [Oryza sativa Japonica Group]